MSNVTRFKATKAAVRFPAFEIDPELIQRYRCATAKAEEAERAFDAAKDEVTASIQAIEASVPPGATLRWSHAGELEIVAAFDLSGAVVVSDASTPGADYPDFPF